MQPQDSGGLDWWHAMTGAGGGIIGTFLTWFWRAARVEPTIRADFRNDINEAERRVEEKVESMTSHFREYFDGIRRQQDDLRLNVEEKFVRKDDFKEFRDEWREAVRDLKQSIQNIANGGRQ